MCSQADGNKAFKTKKYADALRFYSKALTHVNNIDADASFDPSAPTSSTQAPPLILSMRCMLHNNRALCYLKLKECEKAIRECAIVLDTLPPPPPTSAEEEPSDDDEDPYKSLRSKAHYRRGMAHRYVVLRRLSLHWGSCDCILTFHFPCSFGAHSYISFPFRVSSAS